MAGFRSFHSKGGTAVPFVKKTKCFPNRVGIAKLGYLTTAQNLTLNPSTLDRAMDRGCQGSDTNILGGRK